MDFFSNDRDILKYEPRLFTELYPSGQVLASGSTGSLSGTTFTKAGADFVAAGVLAGNVIYLKSTTSGVDAAFEIVSVDLATQLTVSVLRTNTDDAAISPNGDASDYDYRIATYSPQAKDVLFEITQYFGIAPGNPDSDYSQEDLLDSEVLRLMSMFAIISAVYATLATGLDSEDAYWEKSFYYRRLFEKARARCRVDIDLGQDGIKDLSRYASSPRMMRD
mgnify:CR=1 FL=1